VNSGRRTSWTGYLHMSDLAIIVEGQTEHAFVRDVLAPHLRGFGVGAWARLPGRVHRRGGVPAWEAVQGDVLRTLRERRGRYCTTMFDFYAMPLDWPGRKDASARAVNERGEFVETALLRDIAERAGDDFNAALFIPYVQVHEFEAVVFSNVDILSATLSPLCRTSPDRLAAVFGSIVAEAGEPEAIDDRPEYAPSKRILSQVPAYRKALYGPMIANRIGIQAIRGVCHHFNAWLQRLESLGG
jgi:hypothetical protein